jgi:hypothetical protein
VEDFEGRVNAPKELSFLSPPRERTEVRGSLVAATGRVMKDQLK